MRVLAAISALYTNTLYETIRYSYKYTKRKGEGGLSI